METFRVSVIVPNATWSSMRFNLLVCTLHYYHLRPASYFTGALFIVLWPHHLHQIFHTPSQPIIIHINLHTRYKITSVWHPCRIVTFQTVITKCVVFITAITKQTTGGICHILNWYFNPIWIYDVIFVEYWLSGESFTIKGPNKSKYQVSNHYYKMDRFYCEMGKNINNFFTIWLLLFQNEYFLQNKPFITKWATYAINRSNVKLYIYIYRYVCVCVCVCVCDCVCVCVCVWLCVCDCMCVCVFYMTLVE